MVSKIKHNGVYAKIYSVTFSGGSGVINDDCIKTTSKIFITREINTVSSLTFTAKVLQDGKMQVTGYNCAGAGSVYNGTTSLFVLITNQ